MPDLSRITRLAGWLYHIASASMVLLPLVVAVFAWRGQADPSWLDQSFPALPSGTELTPAKSTQVIALGAIALVPITMALLQMRALFARYRRGEILTLPCARHIFRAGQALVLLAMAQLVILPLQVIALTADNPSGDRHIIINFSSETLWLLLSGGLLIVVGWVMVEATRAAEENAGFI